MYRLLSEIKDVFSVFDSSNLPVTGLTNSSFTKLLVNPNNDIDTATTISISEIGQGFYSIMFIPSIVGTWFLNLKHDTYFPYGKSCTYKVLNNDCDSLSVSLSRLLGLTQENQYIDNMTYNSDGNMTSSRLRIYSDSSSVSTTNNVIATYNITATYSGLNLLSYKVTKV